MGSTDYRDQMASAIVNMGKRGSELDRLRAENEATRSVANKLVGALNLDLPLSDSTEMLLTHVYHRVQEMQYMIRQLAALAAKGG